MSLCLVCSLTATDSCFAVPTGLQGLGISAVCLLAHSLHTACVCGAGHRALRLPQGRVQELGVGEGVLQSQTWQMCVNRAERCFAGASQENPSVCAAAMPSLAHSARNGHSPVLPLDKGG